MDELKASLLVSHHTSNLKQSLFALSESVAQMKVLKLITGSLCPSAGLHLIEVLLDEVSVPKSPFRVSVAEGCDPSRVCAFGPGLEEGLVNKSNRFTVETRSFYILTLRGI